MNFNERYSAGPTLPRFFREWKQQMADLGNSVTHFTPVNYLNQPEGPPFIIAAQWLFCPRFIEYRDCAILTKGPQEDPGGFDTWFDHLNGDLSRVEGKVNLVNISDLFTASMMEPETEPDDEDLSQLAGTLAQCWHALLRQQFPDRRFEVFVMDDETTNGPEVSFFTIRPGEEERFTVTEGVTVRYRDL